MELLRMLALLAGTVGLLRAAVTTTESATTIKAVPLNDEVEEGLRQEEEEESTTETESLGTIPTTTTSTSTTSRQPTTSTQAETTTSHPGLIKWAPYRGPSEGRKKGGERKKKASFPKLRPVKGRWISRDKAEAKLLNVRPGFLLPAMEVGDFPTREKSKGKIREKRHSGDHSPDGSVVAVCGGTFRDLYGVIQSPDYPLYYPNNKKCTFDIEVPENHTLKLTCDRFMMQGGQNCSHDYMMVDYTGDSMFAHGQKFCGLDPPSLVSNGTRMTVMFQSDDLFRYQGFSCRYRALMPNGNAVIGSFGNTTDNNPYPSGNNFLQVVQCPSVGNSVMMDHTDADAGANANTGASLYSGMWNGQCGGTLPGLPPTNRIVGGYATQEFEFPWMAAVLKKCDSEYCHICGATIISESWILTGAHCMVNVQTEDLAVLVGDHNLYTISNSQKFIQVKEKVVHPDYNKRGNLTSPLNNDIGLLRLEYPIVFTSQISPLCLPALGETGFGGSAYGNGSNTELDTTGLDIVGKNATVLGWGMTNDDGVFSDALRGVEVEILDNDECNRLFGIMTETMMCTSGSNGRGTCYGDSGGPAIVKQPDGSYVQVGILSFGALAGCEKGYPSGQVLVHKYIDWIQAITGIAFGAIFG